MSRVMRRILAVFAMATLVGGALVGCGPDDQIFDTRMTLFDAEVLEVGSTTASLRWRTTVAGDTRVDLALVAAGISEASRESVSDDLYQPRLEGGGVSGLPQVDGTTVSYPDAQFEHVSDTRYVTGNFVTVHNVVVDRLLPDRIYVATVSSSNGLGAQAREYGAKLTFRTSPAN